MYILSVDTALTGCHVSVLDSLNDQISTESIDIKRGQAEQLMPLIESVLDNSGVGYKDLSAIAVSNGPGAFTGMRVGLSSARVLALTLDIPVLGITCFDMYYEAYRAKKDLVGVAIDTKRNDFYSVFYSKNGEVLHPPDVRQGSDIQSIMGVHEDGMIVGDGANLLASHGEGVPSGWSVDIGADFRSSEQLAKIALRYFEENGVGQGYQAVNVEPFYIRGADVSKSKKIYKSIG